MTVLLVLPAIVVTICFFVILFGIETRPGADTGGIDSADSAWLTLVLGLVMAGLIAIRLQGPGSPLAWAADRRSASPRWSRSCATRPARRPDHRRPALRAARRSGRCS